jgi:hypothetical protein
VRFFGRRFPNRCLGTRLFEFEKRLGRLARLAQVDGYGIDLAKLTRCSVPAFDGLDLG